MGLGEELLGVFRAFLQFGLQTRHGIEECLYSLGRVGRKQKAAFVTRLTENPGSEQLSHAVALRIRWRRSGAAPTRGHVLQQRPPRSAPPAALRGRQAGTRRPPHGLHRRVLRRARPLHPRARLRTSHQRAPTPSDHRGAAEEVRPALHGCARQRRTFPPTKSSVRPSDPTSNSARRSRCRTPMRRPTTSFIHSARFLGGPGPVTKKRCEAGGTYRSALAEPDRRRPECLSRTRESVTKPVVASPERQSAGYIPPPRSNGLGVERPCRLYTDPKLSALPEKCPLNPGSRRAPRPLRSIERAGARGPRNRGAATSRPWSRTDSGRSISTGSTARSSPRSSAGTRRHLLRLRRRGRAPPRVPAAPRRTGLHLCARGPVLLGAGRDRCRAHGHRARP